MSWESDGQQDLHRRHQIAKGVFTTLLADQVGRSESLNATNGVLAGLGGVVTTLAGLVSSLAAHDIGRAGIAAAGFSVVLAVGGLITRRPGREPIDPDALLDRILHTGDVTLTEDVLLYMDVAAARRNEWRLRWKARWTFGAAIALAGAVCLIVATTMAYGTS